MSHKLEDELKDFIVQNKPKNIGDFAVAFSNHPKINHILTIAADMMVMEDSCFNETFKKTRDFETTKELIEEYGSYDNLAKLFIPETVASIIVYKKMAMLEQASNLLNDLVNSDSAKYCEQINYYSDIIFDGPILLMAKNFKAGVNDQFGWIEDKIKNNELDPNSDKESKEMYENYCYYRLSQFSLLNNEQMEEFLNLLAQPQKTNLQKNSRGINICLIGKTTDSGVMFNIDLDTFSNLLEGKSILPKIKKSNKSKKEIMQGIFKKTVNGEIKDAIVDYAAGKTPFATEVKLAYRVIEACVSETIEMTIDSITPLVKKLGKELEANKSLTVKELYVEYGIKVLLVEILKAQGFEATAEDLRSLNLERLYYKFIQTVFLGLSDEECEEAELKAAKNSALDVDTLKFKIMYENLTAYPHEKLNKFIKEQEKRLAS